MKIYLDSTRSCFRIGVAIPVYASTRVRLDGDGGVVVDFDSSIHVFRPVSVQAMWTMFQRLQKVWFLSLKKKKKTGFFVLGVARFLNIRAKVRRLIVTIKLVYCSVGS